jgi:hypothetical protein
VYLTIEKGTSLVVPDELRVTAFAENGALFENQRVPATGVPSLPGTVTLYVGAGVSNLRVDVRGYVGQALRMQATTRVRVVSARQVSARVVLEPAAAVGSDGGTDGGTDGGSERVADALLDDADARDAGMPLADAGADGRADAGAASDGAVPDVTSDRGAEAGTDAGPADTGTADTGSPGRCQGSSLVGLAAIPSSPVNLTTEGVVDWRHWGLGGSVDYKRTAGDKISDYTLIGAGTVATRFRNAVTYSWSDGSPTATGMAVDEVVAVLGSGAGVSLTVPADVVARTFSLYVGGENNSALFIASLSDGCVADYSDAPTEGRQAYQRVYRLTFKSAVAGTQLSIRWTMTAGHEGIGLEAATLY